MSRNLWVGLFLREMESIDSSAGEMTTRQWNSLKFIPALLRNRSKRRQGRIRSGWILRELLGKFGLLIISTIILPRIKRIFLPCKMMVMTVYSSFRFAESDK